MAERNNGVQRLDTAVAMRPLSERYLTAPVCLDDVDSLRRACRGVVLRRRMRNAQHGLQRFMASRPRPRAPRARRRRATCSRSGSRGDPPDEPAQAVAAALLDDGGTTFFCILRASFVVYDGWTHAEFERATDDAWLRGLVEFAHDADGNMWLRLPGVLA